MDDLLDLEYQLRPKKAVDGADKLIKMKKTHSVWEVMEEAIKIWSDTNPTQWQSILLEGKETRETRIDKKFGTSKTKGSNLRYTIDIPMPLFKMMRALYSPQELPMNDKKFFIKFAKKFPQFKVAEKM